jgi:hypothetical protein
MNQKLKNFYFLSESNRNIDFVSLNEKTLGLNVANILGKAKRGFSFLAGGSKNRRYSDKVLNAVAAGSYAGAAWAQEQRAWQDYLANQLAQGPLGRLGAEYKEAGINTMLAPFKLAPQALNASAAINLRRMGRGTPHANIQYGRTEI